MLLQTVQRELRLVVDVDLQRLSHKVSKDAEPHENRTHILHKLLACRADLLGQRGREHHDLLVVGRGAKNLLDVAAHVWWGTDLQVR